MTGLLSPFLYSLPPISSFLDLVAMAALRRRMQVLRKIRPDKPLPPQLVIGFLSHFMLSVSDSFTPPLLSALLASLLLAELDRHGFFRANL
jgi:hypothetical protein